MFRPSAVQDMALKLKPKRLHHNSNRFQLRKAIQVDIFKDAQTLFASSVLDT